MRVKFTAEIEVPDGTPMADVERWLEFHLGVNGELSGSNALADTDLLSVGCNYVFADEC